VQEELDARFFDPGHFHTAGSRISRLEAQHLMKDLATRQNARNQVNQGQFMQLPSKLNQLVHPFKCPRALPTPVHQSLTPREPTPQLRQPSAMMYKSGMSKSPSKPPFTVLLTVMVADLRIGLLAKLTQYRAGVCRTNTFHCLGILETDNLLDLPLSVGPLQALKPWIDFAGPRTVCHNAVCGVVPDVQKCCNRTSILCGHKSSTLPSQYRFLPALTFAKRQLRPSDAWLVLIDDDSVVQPSLLERMLTRLDSTKRLYAGDFSRLKGGRYYEKHYLGRGDPNRLAGTAFACGGSGSIFSRAAVHAMDSDMCSRWFNRRTACAQSDWMIGKCAKLHNISLVLETSCNVCRIQNKQDEVRAIRKMQEGMCISAQYTGVYGNQTGNNSSHEPRLLNEVCALAATVAISHGAC
jgi:hypothetical protein